MKNNEQYLDQVAIEVMKSYVEKQPPQSFKDSISIARIAYKQALAMLKIKSTQLVQLAEESGVVKKQAG